MSFLREIGVLILTYNEAPNIGRTLDALSAFDDILVLDSGSTDGTREIVERNPRCRIEIRPFDNHASQWNYGLERFASGRPWILALDADYVLSAPLVNELSRLEPAPSTAGYRVRFRYCVHGRPLRGALYPPVIALYRREQAHYFQAGHTQRLSISGAIVDLVSLINHDDRKPFDRWLRSQQQYARLEAEYLSNNSRGGLRPSEKVRLARWAAPILVFGYTLLWKGCFLDGWPGWIYVLQRTLAEMMLALELLESDMKKVSAE
jgi:glycosyltransferase involved in cell wall biosynthesis